MTRAMPSTPRASARAGLAPSGDGGRGAGAHRALVSGKRGLVAPAAGRQGVGQRLGTESQRHDGMLVFGRTGQVATEIQALGRVVALGRDDVDLSDPAPVLPPFTPTGPAR